MTISRNIDDHSLEARVLECLGKVYMDRGREQEAVSCFQQCFELSEAIEEPPQNRIGLLGVFGLACLNIGQYDRAIECLKQSLMIRRKLGIKDKLWMNYFLLTIVHVIKRFEITKATIKNLFNKVASNKRKLKYALFFVTGIFIAILIAQIIF